MSLQLRILALVVVCASTLALAQTPSTPASGPAESTYIPTMTFDVASVRQSQDDLAHGITVMGGFQPANSSNLRLTNFDIWNLLSIAYGVNRFQIEGTLKDFNYAFFNIQARGDDTADAKLAKLSKEQVELEHQHMAQTLLADRFNLKAHWESRPGQTYDLVVSKPGRIVSTGAPPSAEELKAWGDRPVPPLHQKGDSRSGFEFIAHGASTGQLASALTGQFGRPVADKTGLTGKYDFDLKYYQTRADDRRDDETNPWPPLETAIQDQLGLKLVRSTGSTQILVIDHIEKPSPN